MEQNTKHLFLIIVFVVFLVFSIWYYKNIHVYALSSMLSGCHIFTSNTTYVSGTTHSKKDENQNINITITIDSLNKLSSEQKLIVLTHELCHRDQILKGTTGNCDSKTGRFIRYLAETECYIKQNFPSSNQNI